MLNHMLYLAPPVRVPPRPRSEACGALGVQPCLAPPPAISVPSTPLAVPTPEKRPLAGDIPLPAVRCSVKACVFPVLLKGHADCRYHELLQSEGELFQSHQPSQLMSLQAPFGIADDEPDDSRFEDRKRQAAEREAFLLDEVA